MTLTPVSRNATRTFAALVGISSVFIILQGLWAGLFMGHPDTDPKNQVWLEVHSWGGKFAILFAFLATVWAVMRVKERRDLQIGAAALTITLVLEAYLGGLISDDGKDIVAAVHVPLALVLTALAVWLPMRARTHLKNTH